MYFVDENSLKYHRQSPNYLSERMGAINNLSFKLRLVFCLADLVTWDSVITLFSVYFIFEMSGFFPEKWWTRNGRSHTFVSWFKVDINSVMEVRQLFFRLHLSWHDLKIFHHLYRVLLLFSDVEVARYIETYKIYDKKPSDLIRERMNSDSEIVCTSLLLWYSSFSIFSLCLYLRILVDA